MQRSAPPPVTVETSRCYVWMGCYAWKLLRYVMGSLTVWMALTRMNFVRTGITLRDDTCKVYKGCGWRCGISSVAKIKRLIECNN